MVSCQQRFGGLEVPSGQIQVGFAFIFGARSTCAGGGGGFGPWTTIEPSFSIGNIHHKTSRSICPSLGSLIDAQQRPVSMHPPPGVT
jgi:hypothetical protein